MALVLLVEDERAIAESLEFALRRDGFQVCHAATLAAAQAALGQSDLVVLDLMLPDGSGFDLLRDMRESGLRTPVIILSSREEEADRVAGLEGGADDYVTKPFSPRELVARLRAVLRRVAPSRPLTAASPVPASAPREVRNGPSRRPRASATSTRPRSCQAWPRSSDSRTRCSSPASPRSSST